ncbi:hypothetical protein EUX98_g3737 [Antrodiella citrinella]|uniref:Uncharacterized protein n=1 Tax=Antrodiella citrinella TaxID=2447956 RepID=A0A4S4MVS4_9APHY|nr:hypothetical protein EUX98_g3737 [Antrodiella citrinella]
MFLSPPAPLDVCEDSTTFGCLLRLFYGYAPKMRMLYFMVVQACKQYDCMRFLEILPP